MTWGESVHYLLIGNPLSSGVFSAVSSVAKSAGITSSTTPTNSKTIMSAALPLWKLAGANLLFVRLAGLSGATAVILGAYGSHRQYPEEKSTELKSVFEVGNRFHFFHSIALMAVPIVHRPEITGTLILLGTILFSGTCYYRAFTGERKFVKLAPIGGCCLILAWASMLL